MGEGSGLSVLYSFPHAIGGAGVNNTAWQEVNALSELGARVTLWCTSVLRPLPDAVRVVETMTLAGKRIPHRAFGVARAYSYHDRRVARALPGTGFDVVHTWPRAAVRTQRAARAHRLLSLRELPNAHTASTFEASARACDEVGVPLPEGYSHRPDEARLRLEQAEFDSADFLLAPSDYVARSFVERGTAPERILRHGYGYEPARFSATGRPDSARPFTAIFVGRGEPPKGLHIALRAWLAAPASEHGRFIILGRLLPEYQRYLEPMLAHHSVQLLGFVDDVADWLRRSDVLVFPTFTEGSALVTMESMACGVVPLVSTAAGAPVTDGVDALLHEVGDEKTLTEQLNRLYAEPDLLATMRTAALRSSERLTWLDAGTKLVRAYRQAMATPVRR